MAAAAAGGAPNDGAAAATVTTTTTTPRTPPPVLNGKRVLPYKIVMTGLQDHRVAAVVCVMNTAYVRNSDGWESAIYIGVTQDLSATLQSLHNADATELRVAHVRALSFVFPQPNAMQEVADDWRRQAIDAGAKLDDLWAGDVLKYLFDDDDDDNDEEDDEESMAMMAEAMSTMRSSSSTASSSAIDAGTTTTSTIVSPFASSASDNVVVGETKIQPQEVKTTVLPFTRESVDTVLNEVREYNSFARFTLPIAPSLFVVIIILHFVVTYYVLVFALLFFIYM
jgi:hypothetical protein